MKRILIALIFAASIAIFSAGPAYASCTQTPLMGPDGKIIICTTCCSILGCSTSCI